MIATPYQCPTDHSRPHVLVFDSGVGGLSITRELVRQLPFIHITYAADNLAFPYGTKTDPELIARIDDILHRLQVQSRAELIVVACNTASTIALPRLREKFSIPIVGVVPAIKPAASLSKSKVIGLLATEATINRPYTNQLINEFAPNTTVIRVGSSKLVELAEAKLQGESIDLEQIKNAVSPFTVAVAEQNLDTVVLACTHFPLLREELQRALPKIEHWVDSGEAIARRVKTLLLPNEDFSEITIPTYSSAPTYQSIFSKTPSKNLFLNDFLVSFFGNRWSLLSG